MNPSTESSSDKNIVQTTGDLAKSVGRFSIAMSVRAAQEAAALVSRPAGGSADDISRTAGNFLSGAVRTVFAVGQNIQCGLVDAAFDVAGMGLKGQQPHGDATALLIPVQAMASRRIAGVRTVASGAVAHSVPQAELVQRLTQYQVEQRGRPVDRGKAVVGLWKSEGLSTSIGKHGLPENKWSDPALPREVLPIAHVGYGSGSTEQMVFDVAKLNALFEEHCAPEYMPFSYEGIGAILRIYERGFFKLMSGSLGLIHLDAPDGPNPAGFFAEYLAQFPQDRQRLIAHGYGRLVAFSNLSIYKAIAEATTYPGERHEALIHGAAFAYAMMNSEDMPKVLEHSEIPYDRPIQTAFQNGLIYSLVFFDWYLPGLLEDWQPQGVIEADLVEHARREAAAARQRGYLLAMRLEEPRA